MMKLRMWLRREDGLSEATTAIFILPILAALIFLLIETGFNINTRTTMDNIVQDTARSAALDGGYNNPRSTLLPSAYTNMAGSNSGWAAVGTQRLQAACNSGMIRSQNSCSSLKIVCNTAIAAFAGDTITCALASPLQYKVVSPLSTSPVFSFGFGPMFTKPISVSVSAASAIGRNG